MVNSTRILSLSVERWILAFFSQRTTHDFSKKWMGIWNFGWVNLDRFRFKFGSA